MSILKSWRYNMIMPNILLAELRDPPPPPPTIYYGSKKRPTFNFKNYSTRHCLLSG